MSPSEDGLDGVHYSLHAGASWSRFKRVLVLDMTARGCLSSVILPSSRWLPMTSTTELLPSGRATSQLEHAGRARASECAGRARFDEQKHAEDNTLEAIFPAGSE